MSNPFDTLGIKPGDKITITPSDDVLRIQVANPDQPVVEIPMSTLGCSKSHAVLMAVAALKECTGLRIVLQHREYTPGHYVFCAVQPQDLELPTPTPHRGTTIDHSRDCLQDMSVFCVRTAPKLRPWARM